MTGEEDADASDPTAFDDEHLGEVLDKPATAPEGAGTAPSPDPATPTPSEAESAPAPRPEQPEPAAEQPEPAGDAAEGLAAEYMIDLKTGKFTLTEKPDWSLVAKAFETFIPECKTIADIEGTEVRYRALSGRSRGLRWTSASDP